MLVVAKFGGTSVRNANAFGQAVKIIQNNSNIRIVILSAIAKVTDKLMGMSKLSYDKRKDVCQDIVTTHKNIIEQLELNNDVVKLFNPIIKELLSLSESEITVRNLNQLLSIGERLSSIILTGLLIKNHTKAFLIDARKLIITNDFGQTIPANKAIQTRCFSKISTKIKDYVIITQGFIGSTKDGLTTTLGRGGSDYSAALFAEALNADLLEIYTDVKGVHTGDPSLILNARLIPKINYDDMLKLSKFGAKILHPDTILPCIRKNIPIYIKSTFCPKNSGTLIDNTKKTITNNLIKAIALKNNQILITIKKSNTTILNLVYKVLKNYKVNVEFFTKKKKSISIILETTNFHKYLTSTYAKQKYFKEIQLMPTITIEDNLSLLTLIVEKKKSSIAFIKQFYYILKSFDSNYIFQNKLHTSQFINTQ